MKILRLLLPTAVLGLAVVFTFPRASIGFVTLGKTNNADNIGFQVFQSSFTDAASNNNTTPDANFPGATGAAMALWKAACEWNSELRGGNGNGDPAQPGDLGSGNSNYDFMYEGLPTMRGQHLGGDHGRRILGERRLRRDPHRIQQRLVDDLRQLSQQWLELGRRPGQ